MNKWSARLHLFNILNLDVAAGAAGMAMLINHIFNQQVPLAWYYLLFSVVWTIYLVDHLYDSRKDEAISERRKFFKKYYRTFGWVLAINVCASLVVFAIQFNILLLAYATPALGITVVYILANWLFQENRQRFYLKEIFISLGYSLGIMVIPLSVRRQIDLQVILLTGMMVVMALWNLLFIARFEKNIDEKEGQTSMSQWVPVAGIKWINYLLYLAFISLGVVYAWYFPVDWAEIVIYMSIGLYMVLPFIFPRFFRKKERYHRYVDMVFLLSFLCCLF